MHIDVLIVCITLLLQTIAVLVIAFLVLRPFLRGYIANKEKSIINDKYSLFASLDPKGLKTVVDDYFESYVNKYIVYKFVSRKITYIKDAEIETMVNDLTKFIAIDISELYVFYIKMNASINTDEDLLRYIRDRVKAQVVDSVSSYNKASISGTE